MSMLRNQSPKPFPKPRKPAYPRVLQAGMLLLLGACSKSNEAQDPPPPPPSGTVTVPIVEAPLPPPSASASEGTDAGAPEVGPDANSDAAVKRKPQPPIPSPPGGIRAPFDEAPPPKPVGSS